MRDLNVGIVDAEEEPEVEYAAHCKGILTSPLRDCISYYNGEGTDRTRQSRLLQWSAKMARAARRGAGVDGALRVRGRLGNQSRPAEAGD